MKIATRQNYSENQHHPARNPKPLKAYASILLKFGIVFGIFIGSFAAPVTASANEVNPAEQISAAGHGQTDPNSTKPPLILNNSYWRLARQGKALIIPGTEIQLGIVDCDDSSIATDRVVFQQYDTTFYARAKMFAEHYDDLSDHPYIFTDEIPDDCYGYTLSLSDLTKIPTGTIISTIKSSQCTTTISKPQLSADLEDYWRKLGLEYVLVVTDQVARTPYDGPATCTSYYLLVYQEDITFNVSHADGYSLTTPLSRGAVMRLNGLRSEERNYDAVCLVNLYDYDSNIDFGYRLPAATDENLASYPAIDFKETTALADFSPESITIPAEETQDLIKKFTTYESRSLPRDVLQGIDQLPASVQQEIKTAHELASAPNSTPRTLRITSPYDDFPQSIIFKRIIIEIYYPSPVTP